MSRRWFGRLMLLAIVLTAVIGAVLLNSVDSLGVDQLQSDIETLAPLTAGVRLLLIVSLYMAWPSLLQFCQQRNWLSAEAQEQLLAKRTRMALWLLVLELVLGFEILNHVGALTDRFMA